MNVKKQVKQYQKVDIPLPGDSFAVLTAPDGSQRKLLPFPLTPISVTYDDHGYETVSRAGEDVPTIRFYPDLPGDYTLRIGENENIQITVTPGDSHGFARVSERDGRYFAYSDGTSEPPIGINLAFPGYTVSSDGNEFGQGGRLCHIGLREYERYFRSCASAGVNLARIWLGSEYLCIDTEEAGVCDGVRLSMVDALVDLAEKYAIRLKLTLDQFRYFDYDRVARTDSFADRIFRNFGKRLRLGDRRCEHTVEWLGDPLWQDAWLRKVKTLADRLSGNPTVFAIELWNEMNCFSFEPMLDWNRRMLPAVKELFPRHLVTNSLGSFDSERAEILYKRFLWEKTDFVQMHRYLDQGAKLDICRVSPLDFLPDGIARLARPDKPILVAETGAVDDCHSGPFRFYRADNDGLIFCDTVYTPLFAGAAGCGHIWHWDERYVESKNLYRFYRPLAELTRGIDFDREGFSPERVENDDIVLFLLRGKNRTLGYLRNKSENWQRRLRDLMPPAPVRESLVKVSLRGDLRVIPIRENEKGKAELRADGLWIRDLDFGLFLEIKQ